FLAMGGVPEEWRGQAAASAFLHRSGRGRHAAAQAEPLVSKISCVTPPRRCKTYLRTTPRVTGRSRWPLGPRRRPRVPPTPHPSPPAPSPRPQYRGVPLNRVRPCFARKEPHMLVLSRRLHEKVVLPGLGITVQVVDIRRGAVRLGIEAPPGVTALREELVGKP